MRCRSLSAAEKPSPPPREARAVHRQHSTVMAAMSHLTEAGRRKPILMSAELHADKVKVSGSRGWRLPWDPAADLWCLQLLCMHKPAFAM